MTLEQMFIGVIVIVCACLGWFARELYSAMQQLRRDLTALEVQIGTDYVRYDRLQDSLKPIIDTMHEIKEILRGKAEK